MDLGLSVLLESTSFSFAVFHLMIPGEFLRSQLHRSVCPETSVGVRMYRGVRAGMGEMGEHWVTSIYVAINIDEWAEFQHYPRGLANVQCKPMQASSSPAGVNSLI